MKLIIAEKPSLAKNIAFALDVKNKKDGYMENDSYIITWCFGHLLSLKNVNDYLNKKVPWNEIPLPYIPKIFEYKEKNDPGVQKQIEVIKSLLNRNDIEYIIHCGDADREGQIIVDLLLSFLHNTKKIKRLWLPEQTEQTIRSQINSVKDNEEYLYLHNEGIARSYLDWLLGINLTVYLTVKAQHKLIVGRVMIPVIKFIYDRDLKIKNFKPENYYQLESLLGNTDITLTSNLKFKDDEKEEAENAARILNNNKAIVEKIENKEISKFPKKLFSLSTLQGFLSKQKISFEKSEKIIQKLYENGYITYPRTNTEFLSENEKEKVKDILKVLDMPDLDFHDSKKIFDSSKVESHSAITITTKIPKDENLTEDEKIVYNTIYNRFISNFVKEKTLINQMQVTIKVGNELFTLKGESIVNDGFLKYEPIKIENKLPAFKEKEEYDINFEVVKKTTVPPKKVTEEELGNFLEKPFKNADTTEDEEYQAILSGTQIGTVATRTETIEKCKKENYISQKGSTYTLEPLGEKLINLLDQLNINLYKEKSVEFGQILKKVSKGSISIDEVLEITKKNLDTIMDQNINVEKIEKEEAESLGNCPICHNGQIHQKKSKEGKIYYNCSNKECKFFVWENAKHFNNPIKLTKVKLKNMLAGKKQVFKLKNKADKEYEAYLKLKINGNYVNFEIDGFPNNKK